MNIIVSKGSFGLPGALLALTVCCGTIGILNTNDASAVIRSPSIQLEVEDPVGVTELTPGKNASDKDKRNYYRAVKITSQDVTNFNVTVSGASADMTGTTGAKLSGIPTGESRSWADFGSAGAGNTNIWGYRWNFSANPEDATLKDYTGVPTGAGETVLQNASPNLDPNGNGVPQPSTPYTSYFTLGFAAAVDNAQPADTYSNTVTVSITAEPMPTTMFDITEMQEMKPDICEATQTPSVSANKTDLTGAHKGDASYVPEVTLTDTRGGGKDGSGQYLIRKLADGNCWMVQNLELDILSKSGDGSTYYTGTTYSGGVYGGQTVNDTFHLTANDTDLNSMTDFTPSIAAEKYNGLKTFATITGTRESTNTAYGWADNGSDGLRSYNYAHSNAEWAYSNPTGSLSSGALAFTSSSSPVAIGVKDVDVSVAAGDSGTTTINQFYNYGANTGMAGFIGADATRGTSGEYQRYGNLYNWTAATLGSGTTLNSEGQEAPDSICPRGWKLPANAADADDSFANLLGAKYYNVSNSTAGYNKINDWPLSFLRTGVYNRVNGYIHGRMVYTNWWSRFSGARILSSDYSKYIESSRDIHTDATNIDPQHNDYRGSGFSLRCISR